MGKIPDCLDSGIHQTVCDLRSFGLWNGKRRHLNIIVLDELLQVVNAPDFNTADYQADESRIDIKHSFDDKTALFKIRVIRNGLSQVSGTNDDQVMLTVNSEDLANFCVQVFYVLAIALLTESSEII